MTGPDKEGCTPLHWAAMKGNGEACTILIQARPFSRRSPYLPAAPLSLPTAPLSLTPPLPSPSPLPHLLCTCQAGGLELLTAVDSSPAAPLPSPSPHRSPLLPTSSAPVRRAVWSC